MIQDVLPSKPKPAQDVFQDVLAGQFKASQDVVLSWPRRDKTCPEAKPQAKQDVTRRVGKLG